MNENKKEQSNDWYVPPDQVANIFFFLCLFLGIYVVIGLLNAKFNGDKTLYYIAIGLGVIGSILLFFARLPLYLKGHFFTFGAKAMTGIYRQIYHAAYVFIVSSVALLLLLIIFLR